MTIILAPTQHNNTNRDNTAFSKNAAVNYQNNNKI